MTAGRRIGMAATLIATPVLTLVALAVGSVAVRALILFASNADLFDLASAIEKGARPDAYYLARFVRSAGIDQPAIDCSDPFTRASLTVNLAALDAASQALDVTLIDAAEANAIRAAEHRIGCNPLDGNAWLHYAIAEMRGRGPVRAAIDALKLSYWATPSEGWIIEPRLAFATNLFLAGIEGFEAEYQADLRRYASFEPAARVAAVYVAMSAQVRLPLHRLIAEQAEPRNKAIVAEIDRLGVDYTREPQ